MGRDFLVLISSCYVLKFVPNYYMNQHTKFEIDFQHFQHAHIRKKSYILRMDGPKLLNENKLRLQKSIDKQ